MKKKNLFVGIISFAISLGLAGCNPQGSVLSSSTPEVKNNNVDDNDYLTANLNVVVNNNYGVAIENVNTTLIQNGAEVIQTDSNGFATFRNLAVGDYKVKIEKEGYASLIKDASIVLSDSALGEVNIAKSTTILAELHKLGATVTGTARMLINGNYQVAANAEIRLNIISSAFLNRLYTTTTNSEGVYTFSNLPESVNYALSGASVTRAGVVYNANTSGTLNTGYVHNANVPISYYVTYSSTGFYINSFTTLKLNEKNSDIIVTFTQPVNPNKGTIVTRSYDNYNEIKVEYTKSWDENYQTLTLKPLIGNWGNESFEFIVRLSGFYSEAGHSLNQTDILVSLPDATYTVTPSITGFKVESNIVSWNSVKNTSYTLLTRKSSENVFVSFNGLAISNINGEDKVVADLNNLYNGLEDGETLEIVIYATLQNGNYIKSEPQTTSITKVEVE